MTFGENLQFLRKRANMTQEDLAEKMEVSRQSVSKWESNVSYPETDAILRLCSLFHCDMDTLLRGDVSRRFGEDASLWDKHMNGFAAAMTAGVVLVLLGVVLMLFVGEFFALEMWAGVIFFLFLAVAVTTFILSGMGHDTFLRQHPGIGPCYTKGGDGPLRAPLPRPHRHPGGHPPAGADRHDPPGAPRPRPVQQGPMGRPVRQLVPAVRHRHRRRPHLGGYPALQVRLP
ncbi:MAG: helix-turn-helix transcriptional regulator [Oscillospiraceae bacterium]|nr:helix-turn-helix transcriptional regulator [Oscillospiraceae bacterium]